MKVYAKQAVALLTVASMALPLAGCFDSHKKVILENADKYASALVDCSIKSIRKQSLDIEDDFVDDLTEKLNWSGDDGEVYDAIKEKITYEVDEDSYELGKKKDEASVDVVFTIVDWESIQDDEDAYEDLDSYLDAIEDSEGTTEVTVTLEFELDGDDWLVANYEEACDDFYDSWLAAQAPINYEDMVDHTTWYYETSEDGDTVIYNNADRIDLDISFTTEFYGQECYYEVAFNGTKVYTSETSSNSREGYFRTSDDGATVTDSGHLAPGEYTITFYHPNGTQLASGTCTVTEEAASIASGDTSPDVEIYDAARVERLKWYYPTSRTNGITDEDTSTIDLDIWFTSNNYGMDCYYEVYFNGSKIYTSETSSSSREGYFRTSYDGASADESGNLAAGEYQIIFYDAQGVRLASDKCTVVGGGAASTVTPLTPADVDHTYWYFADDRTDGHARYDSTTSIDCDVSFVTGRSGLRCYYTVERDGTLVYTSDVSSSSYEGYYRASYDGAATTDSGDLVAGEYRITWFSPDGTQIAQDSCTVTNN